MDDDYYSDDVNVVVTLLPHGDGRPQADRVLWLDGGSKKIPSDPWVQLGG